MKNTDLKPVVLFIASYCLFFIAFKTVSAAAVPQNLQDAINAKSQQLQSIHQQIVGLQSNLEATQGKGRSLSKDINQNNYQLSQLNLSVKSSQINLEKLGLEIDSLNNDISDAQSKIDIKKAAVAALLQEIQIKDTENVLVTFLKNQSLSESLNELENLTSLNSSLATDVQALVILGKELNDKLDLTSQKKKQVQQENENLKNRQIIVSAQKKQKEILLADVQSQAKSYTQQISDLKKMQAAVADEIDRVESELRSKIDPSLLPAPRPGVLAWPLVMTDDGGFGHITQKYGQLSNLYGGKPHNGLDIGAPIGTPIYAAEKGTVLEAWDQDRYCYKGAYGKFVAISHPDNLTTLYGHMSLYVVKKGDSVNRGDLIGYVGSTGYATGPHLHFGLYASQTFIIAPSKVNCGPIMPFGGTLDPLQYL